MRGLLVGAVLLGSAVSSCKGCADGPDLRRVPAGADATDAAPALGSVDASTEPLRSLSDAASLGPGDAGPLGPDTDDDAGASTCWLSYGPAEQPFRGPAALRVVGTDLHVIANDGGKPRTYPVPIPAGAAPIVPSRPTTFVGMRWPGCEVAGAFVYCQGPGGTIVRSRFDGGASKPIVKSRPGTRIAAAPLGTDHAVVGFLDLRRTTEGDVLQAFVALDDGEPTRLSEDGAGATTVRFLPRGDEPVAVYLDVRTAMVPVHARPVRRKPDGDVALGADAVVFVGGAPERGIDFAAASLGEKGFAFVPMPRDTLDFGMVTLPIEAPPRDDVGAVWSLYPNGIDPAPLAAAPSRDGKQAWLARVRPRRKEPGSPRIIELGRVDNAGVYTSFGEIASGAAVTDMTMTEDASGGIWISYGDTTVTWLERRVCSVKAPNKNGVIRGTSR